MARGLIVIAFGALLAAGFAVYLVTSRTEPQQPVTIVMPAPAAPAVTPVPEAPTPVPTPEPARAKAIPPSAPPAPRQTAARQPVQPPAQPDSKPAQPAPAAVQQAAPEAPPPRAAEPPAAAPKPTPREPRTVTIPAGTMLRVRLNESLGTDRNEVGHTFRATLDQPLIVNGFVLAEKGSTQEGQIVALDKPGRVKGRAHMALELTRLHTADGQKVDLRTDTFDKYAAAETKKDAAKVGVAAGIGAAIGAIAGGGKGAAIGAAAGGAAGTGGVLASRGEDVRIPTETVLLFRLKHPVTLTEKLQ